MSVSILCRFIVHLTKSGQHTVNVSFFLMWNAMLFTFNDITLNSTLGSHCLGGKVYTDCGAACPITCENNGSDFACPLICVSGCFCPAGTVDYNGTCIDPLHCPNAQSKCKPPPSETIQYERWYLMTLLWMWVLKNCSVLMAGG